MVEENLTTPTGRRQIMRTSMIGAAILALTFLTGSTVAAQMDGGMMKEDQMKEERMDMKGMEKSQRKMMKEMDQMMEMMHTMMQHMQHMTQDKGMRGEMGDMMKQMEQMREQHRSMMKDQGMMGRGMMGDEKGMMGK
ncbi:MAG: hypothetical protein AB1515_04550 [Nitrospirota bacterium]